MENIKFIFLLISIVVLFSCNDSNIGIFYGLEIEEKLTDNSLPNEVTVGAMTVINSNQLYIAAGKVYKKLSGSGNWTSLPVPSGYNLSTSLASINNTIYAIFFNKDSAQKAIFKLNGSSWDEVSFIHDGTFELIKSADNTLFVSTRTNKNTANLYYSTNGTTFTLVSGITMTGSLFDVVHNGSNYYISNFNRLYTGTAASVSVVPAFNDFNIDYEIKRLYANNNNIYYTYWDRQDLVSYIACYLPANPNSRGTREKLSYILNWIIIFSVSGHEFLLCGTGGRGYYQRDNSSPTNLEITRPRNGALAENYTSAVDMQTCVVLDFFIDKNGAGDGDLYLLTSTTGLWRNYLSGGSRTWSIE